MAAFLFAVGDQLQSQALRHTDSRSGAALSIGSSAVVFWLLAPWLLNPENFFHPAVLIFAGLGLLRPAISANLAIAAIRYLGPTQAGTLSSIAPLFGAIFGVFWLGEVLTWPIATATAGITLAVIFLAQPGRKIARDWPLWALLLPIGAALIRSVSHAATKVGMLQIPDPYFAALVGFSVSALLTAGLQFYQGRNKDRASLTLRGPGPAWFMTSGLAFASAVICLNLALINGTVITVVPIIASAPVFTMALSILVFRREKITGRMLLALGLMIPSVMAIVIWR